MFSNLSLSSTSSATVTPSLVTVGAPHPLSSTALRPRGPSVAFTARASFVTPSNSALRATASNASIFAAMRVSLICRLPCRPQATPSAQTAHYKANAELREDRKLNQNKDLAASSRMAPHVFTVRLAGEREFILHP